MGRSVQLLRGPRLVPGAAIMEAGGKEAEVTEEMEAVNGLSVPPFSRIGSK